MKWFIIHRQEWYDTSCLSFASCVKAFDFHMVATQCEKPDNRHRINSTNQPNNQPTNQPANITSEHTDKHANEHANKHANELTHRMVYMVKD